MKKDVEIELRLVVLKEPLKIFKEIQELNQFGRYVFSNKLDLEIFDRYFDTRDRLLGRKNLGLRLRRENEAIFVTIKGNPELIEKDFVKRSEYETIWGADARESILKFLEGLGMKISNFADLATVDNPDIFFNSLSLVEIHKRYNSRTAISVFDQNSSLDKLLEIALEKMRIPVNSEEIKLYEIELEQKSDDVQALYEIKDYLIGKYKDHLMNWNYSKLATGMAINKLVKNKKFLAALTAKKELTAASYQMISEFFSEKGIGIS